MATFGNTSYLQSKAGCFNFEESSKENCWGYYANWSPPRQLIAYSTPSMLITPSPLAHSDGDENAAEKCFICEKNERMKRSLDQVLASSQRDSNNTTYKKKRHMGLRSSERVARKRKANNWNKENIQCTSPMHDTYNCSPSTMAAVGTCPASKMNSNSVDYAIHDILSAPDEGPTSDCSINATGTGGGSLPAAAQTSSELMDLCQFQSKSSNAVFSPNNVSDWTPVQEITYSSNESSKVRCRKPYYCTKYTCDCEEDEKMNHK